MGSWLGLDNKVIIVTGGSAGIGRSIVKYLIENNAQVVNFDLRVPINLNKKNYYFIKLMCQKTEIEQQVAHVFRKFGRIDGLVNNAGIALPGVNKS